MNAKAIIFARISSTGERQSTASQMADLKRYAEASGMEVVAVYEEKASGASSWPLEGRSYWEVRYLQASATSSSVQVRPMLLSTVF